MGPRGKGCGKGKAKASKTQPKSKTDATMETDEEETTENPSPKGDIEGLCSESGIEIPKGKKPDLLTPDQEQNLSEWFSENPMFYDQIEKDFKNRSKKERLLAEKAAEFNITGADLGMWLKSQRSIFGRLHKKKSGQATKPLTARQKWVMDSFSFLKSHIVVRSDTKQLGKIPSSTEPAYAHDDDDDDSIIDNEPTKQQDDTPGPSNVSRPQSESKGNQAQKRRQVDEAILSLVKKTATTGRLQAQVNEALNERSSNSRTVWATWMGTELQNLPDNLWMAYQKESFSLVMKFKEVAQNQHQPFQQEQYTQQFAPSTVTASTSVGNTFTFIQPQDLSQGPIIFQPEQIQQAQASCWSVPHNTQPSDVDTTQSVSWSSTAVQENDK